MAKLTSGKSLSEKEFQKELEKLNKMEQSKVAITLLGKQTTSSDILNLLKDYNVVDVVLDDKILRVSQNGKYWYGGCLFGISPTSKEKGFTMDERSGAKISVNYTGEDLMKRYLDFFLDDIE